MHLQRQVTRTFIIDIRSSQNFIKCKDCFSSRSLQIHSFFSQKRKKDNRYFYNDLFAFFNDMSIDSRLERKSKKLLFFEILI